MSLQLIEAYVPDKFFSKLDHSLKEYPHVSYWVSKVSPEKQLIRILVKTGQAEDVLNYLESVSNVIDGFEVLLHPVQSYSTRPNERQEEAEEKTEEESKEIKLLRASRQELIGTIESSSKVTLTYILLVVLSSIVVTIGFLKNSEAVIIGAMVIAPMLGPVISIAFASSLGDYRLVWRSTFTLAIAIVIVIMISILFSYFFPIPLEQDQFLLRTHVNLTDIILALASGTAGSLSILNRLPGSLVGVMVAVALLPPTVVLGMTIGVGLWSGAYGSFLLLMVNITSILLSAIVVFSLSGIRPIQWEDIQRANTSRILSFVFVTIIIVLLIAAILSGEHVDMV